MKRHVGAVSASLLLLLAACDKPTSTQVPPATPAQAASTSTPTPTPTVQAETPQAFWTRFRSAVVSGDPAAVAPMVRFPLETRGSMDHDPVIPHDQAAFPALYARILSSDTGLSLEGQSQRQLIESSVEVPPIAIGAGKTMPVDPDATEFRAGNLAFEKSDGRWYWVFAYLDQEEG